MSEIFPVVPGYRFDQKLAEGGMGVVYAATDETLDRKVAIKMIRSELGSLEDGSMGEETLGRFLNEAKAAARIQSSHVAQVLHFGKAKTGDLYLVLEFLEGVTLGELLRKERRLKPERAVRITRQICRGLKAAHDLRIVHRDLKPSNIMLIDQDGDPEFVKILDFGVAKLLGEAESGLTQAGAIVGTYTSMAPEQVQGGTIDARTDVYALGVLLFRLLTGKPPFSGNDPALILHHHVFKQPPRPSELVLENDISQVLEDVVLRCLAKDPEQRVASMAELDGLLKAAMAEGQQGLVTAGSDAASGRPAQAAAAVTTEGEPEDDVVFTNARQPAPAGLDPPTPRTDTGLRGTGATDFANRFSSEAAADLGDENDFEQGLAPAPAGRWLRPAAAGLTMLVVLLVVAMAWMVMAPVAEPAPGTSTVQMATSELGGTAGGNAEPATSTTGAAVETSADPSSAVETQVVKKAKPSGRGSKRSKAEPGKAAHAKPAASKAERSKAKRKASRTSKKAATRTAKNLATTKARKTKRVVAKKPAKKKVVAKKPVKKASTKMRSPQKQSGDVEKKQKPKRGFVRVRTQND